MGYLLILLGNGLNCLNTVYAVISGSVGMLITVLLSALVYKEDFTVRSAISVVCSIAAVVLGVL